ncbi:T9SS type A sorting domain-containing protein [Hymenobacter metallicola]|uniref:T9SS type A sorting domain-containing protein n=1 Tax=Hymenobacter metallicola TaxID=2563114 RepID=A0A4Z0PVH3_9BACT|nr:T9SS type A sorting domain-containing protein [Hymenobacter metallicola]TGE20981.1 T9SS type A sorting domain-containing protein [Hymenobacter metallicola]
MQKTLPLHWLAGLLLTCWNCYNSQAQSVLHDPGFGTNGRVTTAFSAPPNDNAEAVLLQPDGKLVAVGNGSNGLELARYSSNGALDPGFGTGGKVSTYTLPASSGCSNGWSSTTKVYSRTALLQPDGRIVVAGDIGSNNPSFPGGRFNWYVCRYLADGTFDTSFTPFASCGGTIGGSTVKVLRQSTGKLVVIGYNSGVGGCEGGSAQTPRILRLQTNGTQDATFTSSIIGGTSRLQIKDAYVDALDRITTIGHREFCNSSVRVVAGYTTLLHRFLANGQPDPTFGTNGEVSFSFGSNYTMGSVLVPLPTGKLLIAGSNGGASGGFVAQLLADGTLDPDFGTSGIVSQLNLGGYYPTRMVLQPDEKLLLLSGGKLLRLLANGQQDLAFGINGRVDLYSTSAGDLLLQPDGKMVAAGGNSEGFLLERFMPNPTCTQIDAGPNRGSCSGATVRLGNSTNPGAGFTYNWTVSPAIPGFSSTSGNPNVVLPVVTSTTAYTFSLTAAINGNSQCMPTSQVVITVSPNPAPNAPVASPSIVDAGQSVTLSVPSPLAGATYTWTGPGLQPTTGSTVTATPPGTSSSARYVMTAVFGSCTTQAEVQVLVRQPTTTTVWTGASSTNWFTAANWTNGVPSASVDAVVSVVGSGTYPVITTGAAMVRSLSISNGARVTQSGGTLSANGSFLNDGQFVGSNSLVTLTGPVGGASTTHFFNLTIGAAGARLAGPVELEQVLTLNGNLATNGHPLTMLSSPVGTAIVVNSPGVVTGPAIVQRAITAGPNPGLGYRHFSSPVSNTTVADLTTTGFTAVVNPNYNTSATPTSESPFPTVFGYDQSRLTLTNNLSDFDKGWFSPTTLTAPLEVGRGYTVNIGASQLVDFNGTLNNGDIALSFGRNSGPTAASAGWQLVGNPYPSGLSFARIKNSDRVNVDRAMYVFESSDTYGGSYRAYLNGIGADSVAAVGQGFFVRVTEDQTTGSLLLRNGQRLKIADGTTFRRGTTDTRPQLQLQLSDGTTARPDLTYVYFEQGATEGVDPEYDAVKLPNSNGLNLSSLATNTHLAINGMPPVTVPMVVPLVVAVPTAGIYTLNAPALSSMTTMDVYLLDAATGQQINLRLQPSYSFNSTSSVPLASRFSLSFTPARPTATASGLTAAQISVYPNPTRQQFMLLLPPIAGVKQVQAVLYNVLGQPVRQMTVTPGAQTSVDVQSLPGGVYLLRVQIGTYSIAKQVIIQ